MDLNNLANLGALAQQEIGKSAQLRCHEIYENTMYMPNKELRLLDIPLNSSLNFQKLLFYHGTYQLIYIPLMVLGMLHKMQTRSEHLQILYTVVVFLWIPIEYFRVRFGYRGNINETFPELIAF